MNMLLMLVVLLHLSYSLKDDAVFPQVFPNRQQHFEHGTINVSCEGLNGLKDAPTSPSCSQPPSSSITGCRNENVADPNNATYAAISVKRKDGVSKESDVSDPITSTYAVVMRRTETVFNLFLLLSARGKSSYSAQKADSPAPQVTAPEDGQESPSHPGSLQLSEMLRIIFTIFYLLLLVSLVGLLQSRKNKVFTLFLLLTARGKAEKEGDKRGANIAPQVTAHEEVQESPDPRSLQLSEMLRIIFTIFYLAVMVLVVGLLQCRKNKVLNLLLLLTARGKSSYSAQKAVLCFSSATPTPESEARCQKENVADSKNVTYAAVIVKKKDRGC
ncbi:hypothetical protein EXN66_Car013829 [Channa argus]|uniref:Uncharacterized protein n=1 Tax=Channa argus TaxID=215402 RepID=A0A6G1Q7A7_CHAAH|nr:hypothetical protein EXN66_Car013829 [Channa argus]